MRGINNNYSNKNKIEHIFTDDNIPIPRISNLSTEKKEDYPYIVEFLPNKNVLVKYKDVIKTGRIKAVKTNKKETKSYEISFSFPLTIEDLKKKYPNKSGIELYQLGNKNDVEKNFLLINLQTFIKATLKSSKYNKEVLKNKYDEIIKLLQK